MTIVAFANASAAAMPSSAFIWDDGTASQDFITNPLAVAGNFAVKLGFARQSKNRIITSDENADIGADTNRGRAWIFSFNGTTGIWDLEQTIDSPVAASNEFFGGAVAIDDTGRRAIVAKESAGTPAQANVYFYERDPVTGWALEQTLETAYASGSVTTVARLSGDGNVLLLRNNTSQGIMEIWRYQTLTSTYVREFTIAPGFNDSSGQSCAISRDGRAVIFTIHGRAWVDVYYDSTGSGAWALRESIQTGLSGISVTDDAIDINGDGTLFAFANQTTDDLEVWKWDGANYNKLTNPDLAITNPRVGAISYDGNAAMTADPGTTDPGALLTTEPDGVDEYALTNTIAPTSVPLSGSGNYGRMSDDGNVALVGNNGFDSGQGRLIVYRANNPHTRITDQAYSGTGSPNVASYDLSKDGIMTRNGGTGTTGEWWTAGNVTDIGAGFEARATPISTSGTGNIGGDFFNTWLSLGTSRSWTYTQNSSGNSTLVLAIEIRRASDQVVVSYAEITLQVTLP